MKADLSGLFLISLLAAGVVAMANSTAARDELPPCPPRERGEPKPAGCLDPCPKGLVSTEQGCTCPPGTVLAARPESPSKRCVPKKLPYILEPGPKYKDLIRP